tara:strand:+ start:3315 stop:4754 length:1440 start_codon:yes stop_codon:yes gene_type:complete
LNLKKNNKLSSYLVLTLVPALIIIFTRAFGFDGLYGQDSYEYLRYSNALYNAFNGGESAGDYFWPLYYPLLGAIANFLFGNMVITLSLINFISLIISSVYLFKIIYLLYDSTEYALHFIILFFTLSPSILVLSVVIMSDLLSTCFIILTIYHTLKFNKQTLTTSLYYAAVFAISAIMTRYASFVVLLPFGFLILIKLLKTKRKLIHLIPILIILCILSIPHFYIRSENVSKFLNHDWLQQWSFLNFYKSEFNTIDGVSYNKLPNIIYAFYNAFHPKYLSIGIVLIVAIVFKKLKYKTNKTLLISYVLYSLFLAGIPFQNFRFLVLSFGLTLILLFPVFQSLTIKISAHNKIRNSIFAFILLIQIFLCYYVFQPFYLRNKLEKNIVSLIKPYQNNTLYSFDIDVALKGRALNFDYKNMWVERYNEFNSNSMVLFNPDKFKMQWKDKNPMLNWENMKYNYNLKLIEKGPQGWKLYEIKSKK